jgi:hypothetical protein
MGMGRKTSKEGVAAALSVSVGSSTPLYMCPGATAGTVLNPRTTSTDDKKIYICVSAIAKYGRT